MSISNRKVVIVGAGHVGSHVGYALISQSLADEIVYIDSDHAKGSRTGVRPDRCDQLPSGSHQGHRG